MKTGLKLGYSIVILGGLAVVFQNCGGFRPNNIAISAASSKDAPTPRTNVGQTPSPVPVPTATPALSYNLGEDRDLASISDYEQEQQLLASACSTTDKTCNQAVLETWVNSVRAASPLKSALSETSVQSNLAKALGFMVLDYATNLATKRLRLPTNAPTGVTAAGKVLQNDPTNGNWPLVYWLGDNGIYVSGAFNQFIPPLGRLMHDAYFANWNADPVLGKFCPTGQSHYAIGVLPANERYAQSPSSVEDARCQYASAGTAYFMFTMQQSVDNALSSIQFGSASSGITAVSLNTLPVPSPAPILGTDHEQGAAPTKVVALNSAGARDLLKYGCLRQVTLGNISAAKAMFAQAMDVWNAADSGFASPKAPAGTYDTRELAFALMCANAIGYGGNATFSGSQVDGSGHAVTNIAKAAIETALWAAQTDDGGLWTNYASASYCASKTCYAASQATTRLMIPAFAKQTEEITPLAVLAYGGNIWVH